MLGRTMGAPRRALGLWGFGAVALVGLIIAAYPRPADSSVLDAYQTLEAAPVPVAAVGWIEPSSAQARLLTTGYVLSVEATGLGSIAISGNRDPNQVPEDALSWQQAGTTYWLETSGDPELVRARVTTLENARQQLIGSTVLDTPALYLFYLPVFLVFCVWASVSLLWRR